MKIWLITAFDAIPTDNVKPMRFMGLANSLLKRGHSVTLWAGSFSPFNNSQRVKKDTFITYNKNV